jgi:hypothetical protein
MDNKEQDQLNLDVIRREATAAERARVTEINEAVRGLRLDQSFADELIAKDTSADEARRLAIAKAAERSNDTIKPPMGHIETLVDEVETRRAGVEEALLHRYNPAQHKLSDNGKRFSGLSLIEIANAIAATHLFAKKNLIIIDLGTATTFCAINKEKEYLGGSIATGLRLCMEALESKTAKLPAVEIISTADVLGRSTVESIQSGLFYGHLGIMKEISRRLSDECFDGEKPYIIGTGGFSSLFEKEKVFDTIQPDLVLKGLILALKLNA